MVCIQNYHFIISLNFLLVMFKSILNKNIKIQTTRKDK